MATNLVPFSSDGGFITAGNITSAVSASPAPTISGFSTVSADNFRLMSGNITGGIATVVDDGINSIALAPGAQMDVFGFPFSQITRGQLTISGVATPSEVNGTWYYQSVNTNTYQIYTDSTYSTLVNASSWSAYTGGGTVAITKQVPAANIVINSNGYFSTFDNTGDLTLPGDLLIANNASITTTNATGNVVGKSINIRAGAADQGDYYTTAGGNLNLIGGLGAGNDGGGGGPGGAVNIISGASADVAGHAGNVTINTGGGNTWTFDYTGMLTVPGEGVINSVDDTITLRSFNTSTGNANSVYLGSSGGLGFSDQEAGGNWLEIFRNGAEPQITVPVGRGNLYIQTASGNTPYNWTFGDTGSLTLPNSSILTFGDVPVTNRYYVDATRTDTYTQNGSQSRPFKTIAAAQAAIATAISGGLNPEVEPIYIILLSNITENVTLATNHVYLNGQNGQIHQPIILTGNITIQPTSGTLNSNHFSISGMEIVGGTNGKAIYVTGTYPTRLSLQDVWITANGNSGAGLYQDNTGTGTYTHGGPVKVSHNGTGDVYCFDIRKGTASFDTVETSGATQVGAASPGATLTFNNSQLEANGNVVVETYGNGVVVVTNSVIKNSAANSSGIRLNAVANVAGTVSVGQSAFNVPLGTGQAVWLDPNTTPGLSGVFAWSGASFYPNTNTTISANVIPGPLAILVGTQVSPIFYGDITSYAVAQDWDLIDNNASALSFDTTGKAGVLELVTTNSAEGVKMSGYANVVGNITGGNITTAGNITGNTAGFAIGYRDIPQVSLSSNVTTALTDAGKHYYSVSASNLALTIANNSSVVWPVGAAISIVNRGTANITIAGDTGVSLYLAGNSTAGNRTVTTYGMATVMNVAANIWMISGTVV